MGWWEAVGKEKRRAAGTAPDAAVGGLIAGAVVRSPESLAEEGGGK